MVLCGHLRWLVIAHEHPCDQRTLRVLDDAWHLALHESNGRVGGTQVDTDNGALDLLLAALSVSAREPLGHGGAEDGSAPCCCSTRQSLDMSVIAQAHLSVDTYSP